VKRYGLEQTMRGVGRPKKMMTDPSFPFSLTKQKCMNENQPKSINEISDKEVEAYARLSDFSVGKIFFVILIIASTIGFFWKGWMGVVGAVVIVAAFKFVIMPIFARVGESVAKKYDPKGYSEYLAWKKREYHKKYYGNGVGESPDKDGK